LRRKGKIIEDFTEEEVEAYKTLLDKAGKDIVEICRGLSCGGKGK
jgi:hypothetical protein